MTASDMEKIMFTAPDTGERLEFYVLEQTSVSGRDYLLVTEEDAGDAEAYLLRRVSNASGEETDYEFVTDEEELAGIGRVFAELVEDTDFVF